MELIDRDALHQTFMKWFKKEMLNDEKISKTISWADALLREEPEVDAVPVIRCKDCRHWQCDDYESYCDELGIFGTDMNSYCSYAKRREK